MAVDTPATIAILGAGPIGLEAALYARFLGYEVRVYERGRIAENVRRWGHVRMFSPFGMNRSPLGLAALAAQDQRYKPPADDALLTGRQWVTEYLLPLAASDLLADRVHPNTAVVAVGRDGVLKGDLAGDEARGDLDFRLLLRTPDGVEQIDTADAVIDTSGVFGQPNWLGSGGIPAVGEIQWRDRIDYAVPDILGDDRERFAGKHTLLIGAGYSAATNVVALARLAREHAETRVTWLTRRAADGGPIAAIENDRLGERAQLTRQANELVIAGDEAIEFLPATVVEAIGIDGATDRFHVRVAGGREGAIDVDRIIANVGFHGDWSIVDELQLHRCWTSDAPIKLAAALLGQSSADCLEQVSGGPQSLLNPEPNFYVLGAKSYGRNSRFLVSIGLEQIRDLFTIIGDRADLDLYQNFSRTGV